MAHYNLPQFSLSGNVTAPANNDSDSGHHWQSALPGSEQVGDHHRVVIYTSFHNQTVMHANGTAGASGTPVAIDRPQQFYHQPIEPVHVPDQQLYQSQQHFGDSRAIGLLADSNQHATIDPSQTITYPLTPDSETREQYFHGGSVDQPLPYLVQPNPHFQFPQQQLQGKPEYPPLYVNTYNVPAMRAPAGSLHLVPPAYNYAANHPSSANNRFLTSLLDKGAHRLAYVFMDASSDMWIYACNNVIGNDGPTELLMNQIIGNAGFRQMLKSLHLQAEICTVTVHIPESPGGRQVVEKEVLADPNDVDFMRAFRNELQCVPDCIYKHFWKCSRYLLQPSARCRGIFSSPPGSPLDKEVHDKLDWAFKQNDEWGLGIFHEIIKDENGFRTGRWFHNSDFIDMLQEGMFDITSPGWFGFIEATTDLNSSWKMTECPTAHLFAVAISWLVVTAHCDFLRIHAVTVDWVSNT